VDDNFYIVRPGDAQVLVKFDIQVETRPGQHVAMAGLQLTPHSLLCPTICVSYLVVIPVTIRHQSDKISNIGIQDDPQSHDIVGFNTG
jgi:hypothetical protein